MSIGKRIDAIIKVLDDCGIVTNKAMEPTDHIPDHIVELISCAVIANRKILAIKAVRAQTGWGLRQAKDYVDSFQVQVQTVQPLYC